MIMAVLPGIQSTADRETAMNHSAERLSIFVAVFLIALKSSSGWLTGSLSVWASLLDSVLDLFASTLNFIAVRAASRPADEDHAYGHGKAESLTGLFQAIVIGANRNGDLDNDTQTPEHSRG